MYIYTIGSGKKSAEQFFERIKYHEIQMLVDVRLKNESQLLGFARKRDLPYLLGLINCKYDHGVNYAPTQEILTGWKTKQLTWPEYEEQYRALMSERESVRDFLACYDELYDSVCLLCSEPTPEHCHRRLLAEMIHQRRPDIEIIHI